MVWCVQLTFDASDPDGLMVFWGHALQHPWISTLDVASLREWRKDYPQYDGRGRIDDQGTHHIPIYMQTVPEPKFGRNRVRLELGARDVEQARSEVLALGATTANGELADVGGNEFTIVPGREDVERAFRTIVIDALDPDRMLEFWAEATGYRVDGGRLEPIAGRTEIKGGWIHIDGERALEPSFIVQPTPDRPILDLSPGITFNKVTAPKTDKNRLHIDLASTEGDADRDRLLKLGATVQRWDDEHVMQDPEGNEFCLN